MKRMGIIGCGWLGLRIASHFYSSYKIYATTTSAINKNKLCSLGFETIAVKFSDDEIMPGQKNCGIINHLDAIIITVPFSKQTNIKHLEKRFENMSLFISGFKKHLFLMSSIGIYPQIDTDIEEDTFDEDDLDQNILFVENLIKSKFPQLNILRLGGLMGDDRIFSKYKVSDLNQIVNHVHYNDICLVINQMIDENVSGKTYNVVAPLHPRKIDIINYQKGIQAEIEFESQLRGRKILTNRLERDLNFKFTNLDPRKFE
jgi:hypothetical protein